jgi:hypothetical protein
MMMGAWEAHFVMSLGCYFEESEYGAYEMGIR